MITWTKQADGRLEAEDFDCTITRKALGGQRHALFTLHYQGEPVDSGTLKACKERAELLLAMNPNRPPDEEAHPREFDSAIPVPVERVTIDPESLVKKIGEENVAEIAAAIDLVPLSALLVGLARSAALSELRMDKGDGQTIVIEDAGDGIVVPASFEEEIIQTTLLNDLKPFPFIAAFNGPLTEEIKKEAAETLTEFQQTVVENVESGEFLFELPEDRFGKFDEGYEFQTEDGGAATMTAVKTKERILRPGNANEPLSVHVQKAIQPKPKIDPQAVLDRLIQKHGPNLPEWSDYVTVLMDVGLTLKDVTDDMLETAKERAEALKLQPPKKEAMVRVPPVAPDPTKINDDFLTWLPPVAGEDETTMNHMWVTECGRYRAVRSVAKFGGGARFVVEYYREIEQAGGGKHAYWEFLKTDKVGEGNYPHEWRNLVGAIEAAEKQHCKVAGKETIGSNAKERIDAAVEWMLDRLPGAAVQKPAKEKTEVKLSPIGCAGESPKRSVKDGKDVDAFGCRLGTNRAKANSLLAKSVGTPLNMAELIEKAGLTSSVSTHVADMKKRGYLKSEGKGYVLTEAGVRKAESLVGS